MVTLTIPMRLESCAGNLREHWSVRHRRVAGQGRDVFVHLLKAARSGDMSRKVPKTVTLTRVGKRLLDQDNLAGSLKGVIDAVARFFGVDDGPKGPIAWKYDQRLGDWEVEITLES